MPPGRIVGGSVPSRVTTSSSWTRRDPAIRGNQIAMIFQEPMTSLNPVLTVGRQITEMLSCTGMTAPPPPSAPSSCWRWWASPRRAPA